MVTFKRAAAGLILGGYVVLLLLMFKTEPRAGAQKCVPIYSATGLECVDSGCAS